MKKSDSKYISEKENYFLFVGRLEENKGIKMLIEVFCEFSKKQDNFLLKIAGSGQESYVNNLRNIVENNNCNHFIQFLGFIDNIDDLMIKATALIVPSVCEGFGRITAEAMFNGCLVIGNNTGGTKEILESENLGLLYSGNLELMRILERVADEGIETFEPMILKAQSIAKELYSQERNSIEVFNLYNKIRQNLHS